MVKFSDGKNTFRQISSLTSLNKFSCSYLFIIVSEFLLNSQFTKHFEIIQNISEK